MKVLVACEYSGIVRDSFTRRGHYALSCDLIPTESTGLHYQGDIFDLIGQDVMDESWDMMIAFPPCTYLCTMGHTWINRKPERRQQREEAFNFVKRLYDSPIERICIENPIGYLNSHWRKPDQIIQPWWYGHAKTKATCLWLKNLPPLFASVVSVEREKWVGTVKGNAATRAKIRSKTFEGLALAMSEQWG